MVLSRRDSENLLCFASSSREKLENASIKKVQITIAVSLLSVEISATFVRFSLLFFFRERERTVSRSSEDQKLESPSNEDTTLGGEGGVYEVNTRGTIRRNVCWKWSGRVVQVG